MLAETTQYLFPAAGTSDILCKCNVLFSVPNWIGEETTPNGHKSLTGVAPVTKGDITDLAPSHLKALKCYFVNVIHWNINDVWMDSRGNDGQLWPWPATGGQQRKMSHCFSVAFPNSVHLPLPRCHLAAGSMSSNLFPSLSPWRHHCHSAYRPQVGALMWS